MVDIVGLPVVGVVLVVVLVVVELLADDEEGTARVGAEEEKAVEVVDSAGAGATAFATLGEGLEERGGAVGAAVELVKLAGAAGVEGAENNALDDVLDELEGFGIRVGFGILAALNLGGLSGCPLSIASCCLA